MDKIHSLYSLLGEKVLALFQIIPSMKPDMRSALIKVCQAQCLPTPDLSPSLWQQTKILFEPPRPWTYIINGAIFSSPMRLILESLVNKPIFAGVVLDLARSLPMSDIDIEQLQKASWFKEISACQSVSAKDWIDFGPLFDLERRNEPLHPTLPPNPYMIQHFHNALVSWRSWVSSTIHYPRANNKFMSHDVRQEYENMTGTSSVGFSQRDYLKFESRTGHSLGGATEIRQRWYRSGMKPRTYYAQGGVYQYTYCLQQLFSELVNCSPVTNHVTRLRPNRLYCYPGQHFRIYDLTSFTSLMWSQKDFICGLANFCLGVPVTLMSAKDGLICRDLGEVLHEYNAVTNMYGELWAGRCPFLEVDYRMYQEVAGMLGVYGNLMTCTLPHGIVMSMFGTDEDQTNVAGDDGILPESEETMGNIREAISVLGLHATSKEFETRQEGCIHLKRPIYQFGQKVFQKPMIIWPNVSAIAEWLYNIQDPRYRVFGTISVSDRISYLGREVLRFLRSIHRSSDLDDDDLFLCGQYLYRLTRQCEGMFDIDLLSGRLTQCGDEVFWPKIPLSVEEIRRDPWTETCIHRFEGHCILPMFEDLEWDGIVETLEVGTELLVNPHKHLSFLVNCGYLEVEPVMIQYSGVYALDRLIKSILHLDLPVNKYVVVDVIPHKFFNY